MLLVSILFLFVFGFMLLRNEDPIPIMCYFYIDMQSDYSITALLLLNKDGF